jgi:formamidopyrimidine-DNA glycosylase
MPELPDITLYLEALRERILGRALERSRVLSPFLLRSVEPPIEVAHGSIATQLERLGKRVAIGFSNDVWLVLHLMIAGRLQWRPSWPRSFTKQTLLALGFAESGTLLMTEAGTRKRASLYVVRGRAALAKHEPGGIEIDRATAAEFEAVLRRRNHTLKRALTDPRLVSGIGNAYSFVARGTHEPIDVG